MSEFVVLGAGMIGVTTALALQERGHEVIVIDRRQPGGGASYGNAGIVQVEVMEPYAFPRAPLDALRLASGSATMSGTIWLLCRRRHCRSPSTISTLPPEGIGQFPQSIGN
jgi:D-amino-acid dehydrogenase